MRITGLDSIERVVNQFSKAEKDISLVYKKSLYDGAKIIADECAKGIDSIPIQQTSKGKPYWGTNDKPLKGITTSQKQGLKDGFGIATFRDDGGTVSTSIGFDGYNDDKFPNTYLARTIESGTFFRQKHPFMRPAVKAAKQRAVEAMERRATEELSKIIE